MNLSRISLCVLAAAVLLGACSGGTDSASLNASAKQSRQITATQKAAATAADYQTDAQALYIAYFGRPADPQGLSNVEAALLAANAPTDIDGLSQAYSTNTAVKNLVDSFAASKESVNLYASTSTLQFVTDVFENLFNRAPAVSGLNFWDTAISSDGLNQSAAALSIYAGSLSNHSTQGQLDAQTIANKMSLASLFTAQLTAQNVAGKYSGVAAADAMRNEMAMINAQTTPATIQSVVASIIANLLGNTTTTTSVTLNAVNWNGAQFVAVGSGGIVETSPDGVTWTNRGSAMSLPLSMAYLRAIVWQNGKYFAVGRNGGGPNCVVGQACPQIVTGVADVILSSTDGVNWSSSIGSNSSFNPPFGSELTGILWAGTQFIAVGDTLTGTTADGYNVGNIITSPDGVNWTSRPTVAPAVGGLYVALFDTLDSIAFSGSQYVAVGANGSVYTSLTGSNDWLEQTSGTGNTLGGVAWSGKQFVAVGQGGTIISSPDGVTWSDHSTGAQNLYAIVWSGTQFVAVGAGTILTSPDGNAWTTRNAGTANSLYGVTWSGTQFVAVGTGVILTSPDGVTWSSTVAP
jgi:hypothetical protein